jgi:hypothetical protein
MEGGAREIYNAIEGERCNSKSDSKKRVGFETTGYIADPLKTIPISVLNVSAMKVYPGENAFHTKSSLKSPA